MITLIILTRPLISAPDFTGNGNLTWFRPQLTTIFTLGCILLKLQLSVNLGISANVKKPWAIVVLNGDSSLAFFKSV